MTRIRRYALAAILVATLAVSARHVLADWRLDLATDKWVRTPAADIDTDASDSQFERALQAYQRGDAGEADDILKEWLGFYRHTRDSQWAMFLQGEARRARGHSFQAYDCYQQLLDAYAGTELFDRALAAQTEIALGFLDGQKRTVLGMFRMGATDEAEDMLLSVFHRDPRGARGKAALLMLADYHFKNGKFEDAEDEYQQLTDNFPKDPEVAKFRQLAAQASLGRFRGTKYDARPLAETEHRLKDFKTRYPEQAQQEQVDQVLSAIAQRRAEKDLETGDFYRRTGKTKAAAFYYRAILKSHPDTAWAAQALERLKAMGMEPTPDTGEAPKVSGVRIQTGPPGSARASGDGVLIGGQGLPNGQLRVLSAGVTPVIRGSIDSPVIDIGPPVNQNVAPVTLPPAQPAPSDAKGTTSGNSPAAPADLLELKLP